MFHVLIHINVIIRAQKVLLLVLLLHLNVAVNGQFPIVRTPDVVVVNRTIPKNALAGGAVMSARFSKTPTDEEIFRVHFFEEPLVPTNGAVVPGENAALVVALAGFSQRTNADDFTSITNFLKKYPKSRWRGSLLANLGIVYRRSGYYGQAMEAWQKSWDLLKQQTNRTSKLLADRVVSELLLINAWVGRKNKMDSLLSEVSRRIIEGPAVERIATARRGLWLMKNKPEISFMCGPYALNKIHTITDSSKTYDKKLSEKQSTSRGFSLTELANMAREAGMNYQMAFRNPGAPIIVNSVVHWKLDHYSALVAADSDYYKCSDATMGTTYGQEFWLSHAALDASGSGYFLIPAGSMPQGWRTVSADEGNKIFGKGQEPPDMGGHLGGGDFQSGGGGCGGCCSNGGGDGNGGSDGPGGGGNDMPMAQSNVHLAAVSLHIFDRPVYYTPPVGPAMEWKMDYHQRDSYQPANFTYSSMGPKWTFNWISYVQDNPNNPSANAIVYGMGGGARIFIFFDSNTQSYYPELQTNDVLVRICPTCYELRHPDGSKEVYARPDGSTINGRKIFLTKKVDAAGNALNIFYDSNLRIVSLQDAIGQVTTISYENIADIYKITRVTDPFGRAATFTYDVYGRLSSITDMIGIVSSFNYDGGDFIKEMTTPYGVTHFIKEDGPGNYRSLETHLPLGEKERVVYADDAPGIAYSEAAVPQGMNLTNQNLIYRNTFYWDKKGMQEAPGDYTKARIYHWLHGSAASGESGSIAPLLESIKYPLENRIWYRYSGQTGSIYANHGMSAKPAFIGRVLDDGTTQLNQYLFNALGADTVRIDPSGRRFSYKYDTNNIDLLEIRQTKNGASELLAKYTYNSQHLLLSEMDASGLITYYTYNSTGQLLTIKNPRNEITTYTYNTDGYLLQISGAVAGANKVFTYDGFGRRRTEIDSEGYTVITDYDALDRPTIISFPDATFKQIVYNRLDPVHSRDRMGRWSHTFYDSLGRINATQDALGRVTQYIWCSCGSISEIVDPLKQITKFQYDIRGRMTARIYNDGKSTLYSYENTTSRVKEITDAMGQKKQFSYFIDNNLKQKDFVNALIATPSVAFTYDAAYDRVTTMTDGTGVTSYSYNPAQSGIGSMKLATIDGPITNDVIGYNYDSLGRINGRSVNGVSSSTTFDALGRVSSTTNVLGNFTYNYVNQTERFSSISLANGQQTLFDYFDNDGDHRLKQIWNKASDNSTISKFDYEYNREGQITKWTQQSGNATPNYYALGYDLADQLIAATQKDQNTSGIIKRYAYQYDKAGNRTSEQIDNSVTAALFNNINQMNTQLDNGRLRFAGTINEFSSVLVKNQTTLDSVVAPVDTTNQFEAFVKTVPGTNNIIIKATDYSGNSNQATNSYNVTVTPGVNNSFTYDDNGNTITSTTPGISYEWDAAKRLVKIISAGGITEFLYDGIDRRVAEKLNGTIIKRWIWDHTELIEERDAGGGTVIKRFFVQGEQVNGINYYYTKDHLGSIGEMVGADGTTINARYDYDPYGKRTKVSGALDADFGFTAHYFHGASALTLAMYRAYDANTGRWLSRDPLGESGGQNLYAYVEGSPINYWDPSGRRRQKLPNKDPRKICDDAVKESDKRLKKLHETLEESVRLMELITEYEIEKIRCPKTFTVIICGDLK